MLTTLRHDRRTRRQVNFNLEALDDRLLLSAAVAGAVADTAGSKSAFIEHRHEVQAARHQATLHRMEARHEAKLDRIEAKFAKAAHPWPPALVTTTIIGGSTSASAKAAAASSTGATPATSATSAPILTTATSTGSSSSDSGSGSNSSGTLPSHVAAVLQSMYQEYESQGGSSSFTPGQPSDKLLQISGTSVEVSLKIASGSNFDTALSQLQSDGMQVSSSSSTYALIEGMLPIAELPAAAQIAASVTPVSPPMLS